MILGCAIFLFASPPVLAADSLASYKAVISVGCAKWNVPEKLVLAIVKQESGNNPWALNVNGKGYMPKSKAEALVIANAAYARGLSFDVGLMQINSYWLKRFGMTPEYAIEPHRNITLGIWILSKEIERYGLTWKAVASYHTSVMRNPDRAKRYAKAVIHHLRQLP